MKDRILKFLQSENKSSAQLADEISVQPSGISHILSGRNKPSLDFVVKMLDRYKYLSTEWLLFGKGEMYKEPQVNTLFVDPPGTIIRSDDEGSDLTGTPEKSGTISFASGKLLHQPDEKQKNGSNKAVRIVWFYNDNTYKEFLPRE